MSQNTNIPVFPSLRPIPKVALRVWDLPIRLFHWSLVLLIGISWLSGKKGAIEVHMVVGLCLFTILLFRFLWGFVGSTTARFSHFVCGPRSLWAYLNGLWRGLPDYSSIGHNPAGSLAIILILMTLAIQITSGLFANDDIYTQGPLAYLVTKATSDFLTTLHKINLTILLIIILLHILVNIFNIFFISKNNIISMITGYKYVYVNNDELSFGSNLKASLTFIISAIIIMIIIL